MHLCTQSCPYPTVFTVEPLWFLLLTFVCASTQNLKERASLRWFSVFCADLKRQDNLWLHLLLGLKRAASAGILGDTKQVNKSWQALHYLVHSPEKIWDFFKVLTGNGKEAGKVRQEDLQWCGTLGDCRRMTYITAAAMSWEWCVCLWVCMPIIMYVHQGRS